MTWVKTSCPSALGMGAQHAEAEPIARRVLETRRRLLGPGHPQTLASMTMLGHVLVLKLATRIIAEDRKGKWIIIPQESLRELGAVPMREVERLLEPALAAQVRLLGPDHPDTLESLEVLARALWHRGDFVNAEWRMRRVAAGRLGVFPT